MPDTPAPQIATEEPTEAAQVKIFTTPLAERICGEPEGHQSGDEDPRSEPPSPPGE